MFKKEKMPEIDDEEVVKADFGDLGSVCMKYKDFKEAFRKALEELGGIEKIKED